LLSRSDRGSGDVVRNADLRAALVTELREGGEARQGSDRPDAGNANIWRADYFPGFGKMATIAGQTTDDTAIFIKLGFAVDNVCELSLLPF
jgi:hypothetical protein